MTREEVIKILKGDAWISCSEKWNEALDIAIKALEQEPCMDCCKITLTEKVGG